MSDSLCTCGHLPHIFSCWGDNGECACREHAAPSTIKTPQPLRYDHMQVPVWPYRTFRRVGVSEWSCPDCERTISADCPRDLLHLPCHEGYVAEPVQKLDDDPCRPMNREELTRLLIQLQYKLAHPNERTQRAISALRTIRDVVHKRQLPITNEIWEIANAALILDPTNHG